MRIHTEIQFIDQIQGEKVMYNFAGLGCLSMVKKIPDQH
jgi:hypothetical protein